MKYAKHVEPGGAAVHGVAESDTTERPSTHPSEGAQRVLAGAWNPVGMAPSLRTCEAHLPVCGTGSRLSSNVMPPRPHWGISPLPTHPWTELSDRYLCVGFLHPTFQPLWLHRHDLPPGP